MGDALNRRQTGVGGMAAIGDARVPFDVITHTSKQSCFPGQLASDRKQEVGLKTISFLSPAIEGERWVTGLCNRQLYRSEFNPEISLIHFANMTFSISLNFFYWFHNKSASIMDKKEENVRVRSSCSKLPQRKTRKKKLQWVVNSGCCKRLAWGLR